MSILYLEIFNLETQKTIGNYEHPELKNSSLKKEIEDKCKELIPQIKTEAKTLKKHINFKNDSKKSLEIYYLLTNSGTLYLVFTELSQENSKTFKDSYITEAIKYYSHEIFLGNQKI